MRKVLLLKKIKVWSLAICMCIYLAGCSNEILEVDLEGNIIGDKAYNTEANIEASINGIYHQLQQVGDIYTGLYNGPMIALSDEAVSGTTSNTNYLELANNEITSNNIVVSAFWNNNYSVIFQANNLIENVRKLNNDLGNRDQALGEARFLRAYALWTLSVYYGSVPLPTTPDYTINNQLLRTDTETIHKFIKEELKECITLLPDSYELYAGQRTRATKQAAQALLSRVSLYNQDWNDVIINSTEVINDPIFELPQNMDAIIANNSKESIWELWFSKSVRNFTSSNIVPDPFQVNPLQPSVIPSSKLINSMADNDLRKAAFFPYQETSEFYYCFKFRNYVNDTDNNTDQPKLIRLAEMYLNRAESYAQLEDLDKAISDLNKIRLRAGIGETEAVTKQEILDDIFKQRFIEFAFEGLRWPDLIRSGRLNEIMSETKPDTWESNDRFFPIPASEIGNNPNLDQNPGY